MGNTIAESKLASKAKLARNGQMQGGSEDESEDSSGSYGKRTPAGPTQQMAVYRQLQQESQANKGIRRMPRRQEPTKDAVSCEKSRLAASKH